MTTVPSLLHTLAQQHIAENQLAQASDKPTPPKVVVGPSVSLRAKYQHERWSAQVVASAPDIPEGMIRPRAFLQDALIEFGGSEFLAIRNYWGPEYIHVPIPQQITGVLGYLRRHQAMPFGQEEMLQSSSSQLRMFISRSNVSKVVVRTDLIPLSLRTEVYVDAAGAVEYSRALKTMEECLTSAGFMLRSPPKEPRGLLSLLGMAR